LSVASCPRSEMRSRPLCARSRTRTSRDWAPCWWPGSAVQLPPWPRGEVRKAPRRAQKRRIAWRKWVGHEGSDLLSAHVRGSVGSGDASHGWESLLLHVSSLRKLTYPALGAMEVRFLSELNCSPDSPACAAGENPGRSDLGRKRGPGDRAAVQVEVAPARLCGRGRRHRWC